ncbi:MAG TPA: hypothetical protein VGS41_00905 [Chthonomonadales bacterium]|nr:hypothetical protein [Chthonomonadales bacterium]
MLEPELRAAPPRKASLRPLRKFARDLVTAAAATVVVIAAIAAASGIWQTFELLRRGRVVSAQVIGREIVPEGSPGFVHYAFAVDGRIVQDRFLVSWSSYPKYRIGTLIPVTYLAENITTHMPGRLTARGVAEMAALSILKLAALSAVVLLPLWWIRRGLSSQLLFARTGAGCPGVITAVKPLGRRMLFPRDVVRYRYQTPEGKPADGACVVHRRTAAGPQPGDMMTILYLPGNSPESRPYVALSAVSVAGAYRLELYEV